MIVLDTSIFIDAIIPFNMERHSIASKLLSIVSEQGLNIYEPQILTIELSGVLVRYKPRDIVEKHINEILRYINIIDYDELHGTAYEIALTTGCRAIDSFFIACAKKTESILVSNDKTQVRNTKKANIKAYHLIEDHKDILKELHKF